MSGEESPLTKLEESATNDEEASPEKEYDEKQDDENGENEEAQFTTSSASAPNTPGNNANPPHHSPIAPHPHNIPIQPYYPPYPYHPYPVMYPGHGPANPAVYTDASAMMDPPPDTRRNRGGVTEPFPEKLHRMLDTCEREGLSDVVSFFSHGRAFNIHKPRRFQTEIMPRFFRQTRLTSFQRQLNLYGFQRISQGPDHGGYYHELFLKGR